MESKCDSKDIALKSFFLGPMAENGDFVTAWLNEILASWIHWRRELNPEDGRAISEEDKNVTEFMEKRSIFHDAMLELNQRYESEISTHSPRYMGHMLSEISLPAIMGHWIALLHNPNNVASEVSRVGIQIEKEAIEDLVKMVGWSPKEAMGHFTSGGSVANFEALFRAREWFKKRHTEKEGVVLVPRNRHYSWFKACKLMGIEESSLWQIDLDHEGKLDPADLERKLAQLEIQGKRAMIVVSVMGTTELGSLDPVHEVNRVLKKYSNSNETPWHHVDAAYGGFFCSIQPKAEEVEFSELKKVMEGLSAVQSMTLDPHKLAYVPYSCGAFICREKPHYYATQTAAPYLENTTEVDRGVFTLEGSRSATGPSATWLSARVMGFHADGLGRVLKKTVSSQKEFESEIKLKVPDAYVLDVGMTNILGLVIAKKGEPLSVTNQRTKALYQAFSPQARGPFIVSKTILKKADYGKFIQTVSSEWSSVLDQEELYVLRLCLMNPFLMSKEMNGKFFHEFCVEIKKAAQLS